MDGSVNGCDVDDCYHCSKRYVWRGLRNKRKKERWMKLEKL